jgi:6-pyruvoyltetrahydropterin/6-carboxytetrahydropterin synthase
MFEAAHTLRREIDKASSARIHEHTYFAEVTVCGFPDAHTGMVDLGTLRERIEQVRVDLDDRMLDEVVGLGPPTLENLCKYIAGRLRRTTTSVSEVRVWREARVMRGVCRSQVRNGIHGSDYLVSAQRFTCARVVCY